MKLHQLILTKNDCYKAGRKIVVKGLMLHSTGANNPKLSRYVGPDDGILGVNPYGNHWNQGGIGKCVHGFIGKDKNGEVRTYQTLPWDHRGWHCAGAANDTHISVEICEDDLTDGAYFAKAYREAVELYAYLCKQFNLKEKNIIDHSEGYKMGLASNHGDVKYWFAKHGKSMDTFRADVKSLLNAESTTSPQSGFIGQIKVLIDGLNVRTGPGREYNSIGKATKGKVYNVISNHKNLWIEIAFADGVHGYVSTGHEDGEEYVALVR